MIRNHPSAHVDEAIASVRSLGMKLTGAQQIVFAAIIKRFSLQRQSTYRAQADLANDTGFCEKTVSRAIAKLERLGLIAVMRARRFVKRGGRWRVRTGFQNRYLFAGTLLEVMQKMTKKVGAVTIVKSGRGFQLRSREASAGPIWVSRPPKGSDRERVFEGLLCEGAKQ
ncbi:helix-turn-helix domain-containing protein [Ferrimonas balearica]|uniref:helix-turn-helix domain-containing protein n=1 Tax=Ferrimonas balearica TaxID=44012 RepID=UPI001C998697|nr:helix-turn-helix domain-containing protein [Ferrimonas balearica]MBY5992526.1 helix-turn-helix domain-containing protein [Ferrimonas balearica]